MLSALRDPTLIHFLFQHPLAKKLGVSCQLENSVQCSSGSFKHLKKDEKPMWPGTYKKRNSTNQTHLPPSSASIRQSSRLHSRSMALPVYYKFPFLFLLFIISALLMHGDEAISCGDG